MPFQLARVSKPSSNLHGQWASLWIWTRASLLMLGQHRRLHSPPISPHSFWRMRMAAAVCFASLICWWLPLAPLTWWLDIPAAGASTQADFGCNLRRWRTQKIASACCRPARGIAASSKARVATLQRRSGQLCCNLMLTSGLVLAASPACTWIHLNGDKLPWFWPRKVMLAGNRNILWSRPWRPSMREWQEVSHLPPGLCSGKSKKV